MTHLGSSGEGLLKRTWLTDGGERRSDLAGADFAHAPAGALADSHDVGEREDADETTFLVDHRKATDLPCLHQAFGDRHVVVRGAREELAIHAVGNAELAERLDSDPARHADVAVRDHAEYAA